MSFPVLERFRKDPVQVASLTPIVSFDLEQHEDNTVIKSKAPGDELFAVRGQARIAALDFVEKSNALMMKVDLKNVEAKVTAEDFMPFYFLPWIRNAIARTTPAQKPLGWARIMRIIRRAVLVPRALPSSLADPIAK